MEDTDFSIRSMQSIDLEAVMDIENVSFRSPWSRQSFENDLKRPDSSCLVSIYHKMITGYLVAWQVLDEIYIGNLAVHPEYRRMGIAQDLINYLLLHCQTINWAWLEVRISNTAAQNLYRKLGFKDISIRKNYYEAEHEDAIVMRKDLRKNIS